MAPAPEVAVGIGAVLEGKSDLALGNAIGSNIFNVLFILGISALITPLIVNIQLIRQEVPIMLGASVLLLFALDGRLGLSDGVILLGLMVVYTTFLVWQSRRQSQAALDEYAGEFAPATPISWFDRLPAQLLLIAVGLGLLVLGSDWLVQASVVFAKALGVSDLVIGLTIVAAGTSMPEVATSVMAAIKGEREIARWEGAVFLAYYVAYVAYLVLAAQKHDALGAFSGTMLSFVLPLTVVALVAVGLRKPAVTNP